MGTGIGGQGKAEDTTSKKKSRWQKLKEENEERKKNNVQHISAKEATERTG